MKTNRLILLLLLIASIMIGSCSKKSKKEIVPDDMDIDLSDAISIPELLKKGYIFEDPILSGRDLYQKLRTLIFVGDHAGDILNKYLKELDQYEITGPGTTSYIGEDDGKTKYVAVTDNVNVLGETWDYFLLTTDEVANPGLALYWNEKPRKAVAILNPLNMNNEAVELRNAFIMIEYDETNPDYDKTMTVHITNIDSTNVSYMSKLRIFIGMEGDVADIYGTTINPAEYLVDNAYTGGRSWCFKARNDIKQDIAVARCALPHVALSSAEMSELWTNNSMDKVLEEEIVAAYPDINPVDLDNYIGSATGLAYFIGSGGFHSSRGQGLD